MSTMLSRLLNVDLVLLQTGAGVHESSEKDRRGSQPPRQYAPTPHSPYWEQHGESLGHLLPDEHLVARTVHAPRKAASVAERRILNKFAT